MDEQTKVAAAKAVVKRHRVRTNFDKHYKERGGISQLERMITARDTVEDMGAWFHVTPARLSTILHVILGMPYSQYLSKKGVQRSRVPRR